MNPENNQIHNIDRDLLIRIDTNLANLMKQFDSHKDDMVKEVAILKETKLDKIIATEMKIEADKIHQVITDKLDKHGRYVNYAVAGFFIFQLGFGAAISTGLLDFQKEPETNQEISQALIQLDAEVKKLQSKAENISKE